MRIGRGRFHGKFDTNPGNKILRPVRARGPGMQKTVLRWLPWRNAREHWRLKIVMNRKQRELAGIAICVASVATFWIRSPDHLTSSCFYAACAWSITADWLLGRMPFLKKNITEIPKSIMQGQFGTSHTAVTRIMSRGAVILVLVGVANFFYS